MNPEWLLAHFDRLSDAPEAIPRMRQFILDLAVRGKLVEQDPSDESASQLLARIQTEDAGLTDKVAKKERQSSIVRLDETPFVVPRSWRWVRLGDRLELINGRAFKPTDWIPEGLPIVRIQNLNNDGAPFNHCDESTVEPRHVVKSGSFLISWLGTPGTSFGAFIWTRGKAALNQHIFSCFQRGEAYFDRFLQLAINGRLDEMIAKAHGGVGLQHITKGKLENLPLPLPPLSEQYRIVAKADELMALCDQLETTRMKREGRRDLLVVASLHHLSNGANAEAFREHSLFYLNHLPSLTTSPNHIKQLRQTILNLAVRGKLVRQDPTNEPASDLLKRVQAEKARSVQEGRLKKDKMKWDGLPTEPPYKLPSNWIWTCLQDVFEVSRGGSPRPAGDPRYFGGKIPWITVGEITKDGEKYLTNTETGLTEEGAARSRFINSGDLLLTNSGATLGVPKISRIRACMNDGVAVLRLFHSVPLNDFAYLHLQSQTDAFRRVNQGMGQPNLNTPIIAGWFFPLPPLAEQRRIVAKVDELMALCDRLETQLSTTQTESRHLLEAVLHEALNGRSETDDGRD